MKGENQMPGVLCEITESAMDCPDHGPTMPNGNRNIEVGETIFVRPILKMKKPEPFRGWDPFSIEVGALYEDRVVDKVGEVYFFSDYRI